MKTMFKPLGVAAAVAAATAGYAGVTSAAELSARNVGDLAIVPYYTVRSGFVTGVHIINTTNKTQVVKVRVRRAEDSMDSLDFNLIMSPEDEWTGSLQMKEDETITFETDDTTCTAPAFTQADGYSFVKMIDSDDPSSVNFRNGAEEGYIEVIGMGEIAVTSPIGVASKHGADGVPADCAKARENFFRVPGAQDPSYTPGDNPVKGVHSPAVTAQLKADGTFGDINTFSHTQDDALKVSWMITDSNAGLELGSNAVHIEGFLDVPSLSNQQSIIFGEQDALGYLFPDLDGGSPWVGTQPSRGKFDAADGVRAVLGASSVQNDWSARDAGTFSVTTDWIITMPGQYLMVNPLEYLLSLDDEEELALCIASSACNRRDLPAKIDITYYDREEAVYRPDEDGLVVSPSFGEQPGENALPYEVNVIQWKQTDGTISAVLDSEFNLDFDPEFDQDRGWASVVLTSSATKQQAVWNYGMDPNDPAEGFVDVTNTAVPAVGFVAWERGFKDAGDAVRNYGRAIEHSYGSVD